MDVNLKEEWSKPTLGLFGTNPTRETPFKIALFSNLLENRVVTKLRDDINSSVKLNRKDNDLYKFQQSKDLKTEIPSEKLTPCIHKFIDTMQQKVHEHLEKLFGLKLSLKNFDITVSRYDKGNYLLCHNDDIKGKSRPGGRALAFIYYLNTRVWKEEDGGALILYDTDSAGEPVEINNSILPKPNTLVVFRTSYRSWHSVQEVYCENDSRLSINGWFHVDNLEESPAGPTMIESCPYELLKPIVLNERLEKFFKECINQDYLMPKTCFAIRKRFKRTSEINLVNFLTKDKYEEISAALKQTASIPENLIHVGPYNKRNYKVLRMESLPPICHDLYEAFQSELFFMLLAQVTGLKLQPPSLRTSNPDSADAQESDDETSSDDESSSDEGSSSEKDSDEAHDDEGDEVIDSESKNSNPKSTESNEDESGCQPEATTKRAIPDTTDASPKKWRRISDPRARIELRHLDTGSYTLIHDFAFELGEKTALDVILHFNHDFSVDFDDGGYISYIDGAPDDSLSGENCELLSVEPKSNSLSLVYRSDEASYRFLKHINKSHKAAYQDLYCVYYEHSEDIPDTKT